MDTVNDAINRIRVGSTGYGNRAHPFDLIKSEMIDEDGQRFGIVLADGVWSGQNAAITAAKECHLEEIDIVGIGFGTADKEFLEKISSAEDMSFLITQGELTQTFGKIAQSLGSSGGTQSQGQSTQGTNTGTWED
jgi:hypothetical protein